METGNKVEMNLILRRFKTDNGLVDYPAILHIPSTERIPQLAKNDFSRVNMLIIGAITMAFESLNLKRGLNEIQVLDLSEAIIDSAAEDNLSFEDLMLFLQKLVRGEYEVGESVNIPKFMNVFEEYREERHREYYRIMEEKHTQNKVHGDTGRIAKRDELEEHFSSMGERLSQMKDNIRNLKEENKNLKMDNL